VSAVIQIDGLGACPYRRGSKFLMELDCVVCRSCLLAIRDCFNEKTFC
jgi:hypothetical protein